MNKDIGKYGIIAVVPLLLSLSGCGVFKSRTAGLNNVRVAAPSQGMAAIDGDPVAVGKKMLAAGNFGSAISAFRLALVQRPESAAAANGLGIAYDAIGRPDLARRYFEQAMGADPANDSYQRNYVRFAAAHGVRAERLASSTVVPGAERDQKLVRLSLGEVKLKTSQEQSPADSHAPVAEVRLSLAGTAPKLVAPIVRSEPQTASVEPVVGPGDLAQAVSAARKRVKLTTRIIDRTGPCVVTESEGGCAS